jgi:hypothetical protein
MLDIDYIIKSLDDYVVIKLNDIYPQYEINQDIDILTNQLEKNINIILTIYDKSIFSHKIIEIKPLKHYQFDLYLLSKPKQLHFRFDLFSVLEYTKFSIHPNVFKYILQNKIRHKNIYIPQLLDDLTIRYAEYIEYSDNIKKHKHLTYTNNFSENNFYKIKGKEQLSLINYNSGKDIYVGLLIWGHCIQHMYDIIEELKQKLKCQVMLIIKKKYDNIENFIKNVYALEMHNSSHIYGKTKYLKTVGNEYFYVLIKKYDYNEKKYGEGSSAVFTDCDVVDFKWYVREKYNPKLEDQTKQPSPNLSPGISHDHVIHATDNDKEVEHLTQIITSKPCKYYKDKIIHSGQEIPYHINGNFKITTVNIDDILCTFHINNNENKKVHIKETPHFMFIQGHKEKYITYFKEYLGTLFTDDHTQNSFENLIEHFNPNTYNYENYRLICLNKNTVLDGTHRLAILYYSGIMNIKVLQM